MTSSPFASYAADKERYDEVFGPEARPRQHWERLARVASGLGNAELGRRARAIRRAVEQDGVTYNVYADAKGTDRPWEVDLLPLVIAPDEWHSLAKGVAQRARLLDLVLGDLYGPRSLLDRGLLPPALVHGNRNYLWPCRGALPAGGTHLHVYGCDLARSADGRWWVIADRTQGPSGAGYALQNRLIIAPTYGGLFRSLGVQRLARFFRALHQRLASLAPTDGEPPLVALLTPGPYNETYFEHVLLARYLGYALVEGSDLTVRDERVYLKTLEGLRRVHVILRRLDDEYCDPSALRADSALGVPGLLGAARAGSVVLANALGSGVLETPALPGFLPAIADELLGEPLLLPSIASWWCGEPPALEHAASHLTELVIKPVFRSMSLEPTFGHRLDEAAREALIERMRATPHAFVAQEWVRLSQAPTWSEARQAFEPRAVGLRLYAVATAQGWEVMPGGLARVSPDGDTEVISMQSGGSSKDLWVLDGAATSWESLLQPRLGARDVVRGAPFSPSRVVENLFWMGRYAERVESIARLLRATAQRLVEGDPASAVEVEALTSLCERARLRILPELDAAAEPPPSDATAADPYEWLVAAVGDPASPNGVAANVARLARAAAHVKNRISLDGWHVVQRLANEHDAPPADLESAASTLDRVLPACAALAGYALDHMTRDEAWRFLVTGRALERVAFMSSTVAELFARPSHERDAALGALLEIANSSIIYRARYQRQPEAIPVLDLCVLDESSPHSVCFQLAELNRQIAKLRERLGFQSSIDLGGALGELRSFDLGTLDAPEAGLGRLRELLLGCEQGAYGLSDAISQRYFDHAGELAQASITA